MFNDLSIKLIIKKINTLFTNNSSSKTGTKLMTFEFRPYYNTILIPKLYLGVNYEFVKIIFINIILSTIMT